MPQAIMLNPPRKSSIVPSWKISKAVKGDGYWRILRHDGVLVGYYDTKELAEKNIAKSPWLHNPYWRDILTGRVTKYSKKAKPSYSVGPYTTGELAEAAEGEKGWEGRGSTLSPAPQYWALGKRAHARGVKIGDQKREFIKRWKEQNPSVGERVEVPDGYYPSGKSRPHRTGRILRKEGTHLIFKYDDDGVTLRIPDYAIFPLKSKNPYMAPALMKAWNPDLTLEYKPQSRVFRPLVRDLPLFNQFRTEAGIEKVTDSNIDQMISAAGRLGWGIEVIDPRFRNNPRRKSRSRFKHKRLHSARRFSRGSFRTIRIGRKRLVVGCPKGHWSARAKYCRVGTRAQAILSPRSRATRRNCCNNPELLIIGNPRRPKSMRRRRRSAPSIHYRGKRWYFISLYTKFGKAKAQRIWRRHRKASHRKGRSGRRQLR